MSREVMFEGVVQRSQHGLNSWIPIRAAICGMDLRSRDVGGYLRTFGAQSFVLKGATSVEKIKVLSSIGL